MKIINERRSIRKYSDEAVSNEIIEKILRAAMQAPSARNQKPWHFLVCTKEKRKDLLEKTSLELKNVSMAKDASFVIIFMTDKTNLLTEMMYPQDLSSAVTMSLLEACENGVGSCWCGIYPNEERMNKIKEIYDIKDYEPFAIVCYGYPQNKEDIKYIERYDESRIHWVK